MINWKEYYTYNNGELVSKYTGRAMCNIDKDGYIRVRREGREFRAHRIIWEMFNGEIPEGFLVDHIDGNTLNNNISNLRLATRAQNNANKTKQKFSEYPKGVTRVGNKYRVRITRNGITKSLGTFDTPEEAGIAYLDAASEADGEFLCVR